NFPRVLGVNNYRVKAEATVPGLPLVPRRVVVQALELLPRGPAVVAEEEACRLHACVNPPSAVRLDVPGPLHCERVFLSFLLFLRVVSWSGLCPLPVLAAIGAFVDDGPPRPCVDTRVVCRFAAAGICDHIVGLVSVEERTEKFPVPARR